jgi:hypothetical protein
MSQQNDQSSPYLRALKMTTGTASAPAPAPASDSTRATTQNSQTVGARATRQAQFSGLEKRRSSRYRCEGKVEMREEGCEVQTWATFTDISLHGCYVEAQATYPAGTILYMKMEAEGIRFETKGDVRINYPYLGMGIAFVEMTEANQLRMKQLLGVVSRPPSIMGPPAATARPSDSPLGGVPVISDHNAAVQALIRYFETRHMLTREDFLDLVRKSQGPPR